MAQLCLLSIFANIAAGLTLAGDYLGEGIQFLSSFKNLPASKTPQIVIGAATTPPGRVHFPPPRRRGLTLSSGTDKRRRVSREAPLSTRE